MKLGFVFCFVLITSSLLASDRITFSSSDGIVITADLYMAHEKSAPFIVLFHQAQWSRGEYAEIAPRLNDAGFNCMAVDLRSGRAINNISNLTFAAAQRAMKPTRYVDAIVDIEAAMSYANEFLAEGKLLAWGSSYSSSLVLQYAGTHDGVVDGVLSFSPGEYFKSQGKAGDFITSSAANIKCAVFITSAKAEKSSWSKIYDAIPEGKKTFYLPNTAGNHGSRALWNKFGDSLGYWDAVNEFLLKFKEE